MGHPTAVNPPRAREQRRAEVGLPTCVPSSACHRRPRAHPDPVVHRGGTRAHPAHPGDPTMPSLAQQSDGLEPANDLFDALALPLTHGRAGMAHGTPIDGAGAPSRVLGHRRCHPPRAQLSDTVTGLIVLLSPHGDPRLAGNPLGHRQGCLPLGRPRRLRQVGIDHHAVPMLSEHLPQIRPLGLVPRGLFVEASLRGSRRGMGGVGAPLPRKSVQGWPGSSGGGDGTSLDCRLQRCCPAYAALQVPSTGQCSADHSPRSSGEMSLNIAAC